MDGKKEQQMGTDGASSAETKGHSSGAVGGGGSKAGPLGAVELSEAERAVRSALDSGHHRDALRLCARHHGAAIGRFCMALTGSQADADDLAQDTLLSAYQAFDGYRAEGSLRAWLLGIARHKCARHVERRARRESKLRLVRDSERQAGSDELVLKRQRAEFARAALDQVRPSEREALVLRYVSELSYREVAEVCSIDEAAARKRVSRAIAKLRTALASKE